jgi:hypothetical protein
LNNVNLKGEALPMDGSGKKRTFIVGLGTGVGVGIALGAGIGMILDNIAIGIAVGLAAGAGAGGVYSAFAGERE